MKEILIFFTLAVLTNVIARIISYVSGKDTQICGIQNSINLLLKLIQGLITTRITKLNWRVISSGLELIGLVCFVTFAVCFREEFTMISCFIVISSFSIELCILCI